ncbi:putative inorganic carbon transporter subunit DabA, partial [Methylogaea oryzae]|uniref:putative inorganic carbon transporter subunit DabA n=1 Tax=Methylogaea oryzae TaxID=1295382 RepID=UPI000AD54549
LSQNNPHLAAYDCGACSGRHGGPNARVFAAMANRPEVRRILEERGISIPSDTWFIGTEHNTANEDILWFDLDLMPPAFGPAISKLQAELEQARHLSAHERCRRLASAPRKPTLKQALNHIVGRSSDFSQARPELGHATNAVAFIGRRSLSRGAFFDRRAFLISYDPTQDPEGAILENILLAAGPVGAGINLEYYFSTVNNDRFGCGSKVPHNVTGLFAVMEGGASDLRTGLPKQMVEIHEAMRLLVVTEHKPEVVAAIYGRQPPLRELIGNAWLQVATVDPIRAPFGNSIPPANLSSSGRDHRKRRPR